MAAADEDDRVARKGLDQLRQLVLDGRASEPGPVADDAFFDNLRDRIRSAS